MDVMIKGRKAHGIRKWATVALLVICSPLLVAGLCILMVAAALASMGSVGTSVLGLGDGE